MHNQPNFQLFRIPLWTLSLQVSCGIIFMLFFEPSFLNTLVGVALTMFYSIVIGMPIFKGYEYIEFRMERKFPWLKEPVKRYGYTVLFQVLLHCSVLLVFMLILFTVESNTNWDTMLSTFLVVMIPGIVFSVAGTFIANSIIFFKNWKAAAVNAEVLKREKLLLEYETLKGQINPHFLFNSFTALSSLVYKDQDKTVEFIKELSNVYRYVLEHRDKELVPLENEIDLLKALSFLYSIRHYESLVVRIDVPVLQGELIVPMSLQMLFENALKHNVVSRKMPLCIDIYKENGWVVVRNNLQTRITVSSSSGIGLPNINSRYKFIAGKQIEVSPSETHFTVRVPILNIAQHEGSNSRG